MLEAQTINSSGQVKQAGIGLDTGCIMHLRPYVAHHIAFVASVGQGNVVNLALGGDGLDGLGIVRGEGW